MNTSQKFLDRVRNALGHPPGWNPSIPATMAVSVTKKEVGNRAKHVRDFMRNDADVLIGRLEITAAEADWIVHRAKSEEAAAAYILGVVQDLKARSIVRSTHDVLDKLDLETRFDLIGVESQQIARGHGLDGEALRQKVINADLGITGVDYAIVETGSCVIIPRQGVSRIVSLVPPVHIAVVRKGQVLADLDQLFTLRRDDFLDANLGSYMNIISGPSRSADIEYTLIKGVHGPGEVHMVLLG